MESHIGTISVIVVGPKKKTEAASRAHCVDHLERAVRFINGVGPYSVRVLDSGNEKAKNYILDGEEKGSVDYDLLENGLRQHGECIEVPGKLLKQVKVRYVVKCDLITWSALDPGTWGKAANGKEYVVDDDFRPDDKLKGFRYGTESHQVAEAQRKEQVQLQTRTAKATEEQVQETRASREVTTKVASGVRDELNQLKGEFGEIKAEMSSLRGIYALSLETEIRKNLKGREKAAALANLAKITGQLQEAESDYTEMEPKKTTDDDGDEDHADIPAAGEESQAA